MMIMNHDYDMVNPRLYNIQNGIFYLKYLEINSRIASIFVVLTIIINPKKYLFGDQY